MVLTLGVVSFLNARPLIDGLENTPGVRCLFDVPARLPQRLAAGEVDLALVPIVDVLREPARYRVVSDACIACDGETLTVRVFSRVPPDRIRQLWVDPDSHTSVALATVLWHEVWHRELERLPLANRPLDDCQAVLLIGDKVVDPKRGSFGYEVDLGGAWRQTTGLPFVFAVWAATTTPHGASLPPDDELAQILNGARDRGARRAAEIAAEHGPPRGWPVELAAHYLARCLRYDLDARAIEGVERFARLCAMANLVPIGARVEWPAEAQRDSAEAAR
jgi:chorismate dehydratase